MKQREFDELIAEDSETNQNESGNQALSSSSSLPPSQTTNPIQGDETEGIWWVYCGWFRDESEWKW